MPYKTYNSSRFFPEISRERNKTCTLSVCTTRLVLTVTQKAVRDFKEAKIEAIGDLFSTTRGPARENFTRAVRLIVAEFQRRVVEEVKLNGWDGRDVDDADDSPKLQWCFAGALLYAVTVVTTIGESHTCRAMGASQGRPGGPSLAQNFCWVGHNAIGSPNNLACICVSYSSVCSQRHRNEFESGEGGTSPARKWGEGHEAPGKKFCRAPPLFWLHK